MTFIFCYIFAIHKRIFIVAIVSFYFKHKSQRRSTVEPRSTDTPLIRTPRYYGQFGIPRPKETTRIKLRATRVAPTFSASGFIRLEQLQELDPFSVVFMLTSL